VSERDVDSSFDSSTDFLDRHVELARKSTTTFQSLLESSYSAVVRTTRHVSVIVTTSLKSIPCRIAKVSYQMHSVTVNYDQKDPEMFI
jgi:hypothetical protein